MLGKEGSLQPTCYHFFESKTPLQAVVSRACKNHGVSRSRTAWREVAVYTPFLRAKIKGKHRKRQTETITLAQKDGTHRNTSEHIRCWNRVESSQGECHLRSGQWVLASIVHVERTQNEVIVQHGRLFAPLVTPSLVHHEKNHEQTRHFPMKMAMARTSKANCGR